MSEIILQEFLKIAGKLNEPHGIGKFIRSASMKFSLNLTILLQWLRVNQRIIQKSNNKNIVLNIGSGDQEFEGCLNADIAPNFGGIIRWLKGRQSYRNKLFVNITYKDSCLKEIANGITFSHVLEHIPPHLALTALQNLNYILKPGGVLRISVPCLSLYDQKDLPPDQNLTTPILAKNSLIYGWNHKFMYDEKLLVCLLKYVGFSEITVCAYKVGVLGDTDVERRKLESIYITGVKI